MSFAEKLRNTWALVPILLLIGGIIVSIYGGLASPTEAAAVGVVLSMIIARFNGHFNRAILPIRCLLRYARPA